MKFFLDSAISMRSHALKMLHIDGVTTNPRHVQASGKPFMAVIREIGALFAGTDKTVSVEVNPHHTAGGGDGGRRAEAGRALAQLRDQAARHRAGYKAIALLKAKAYAPT